VTHHSWVCPLTPGELYIYSRACVGELLVGSRSSGLGREGVRGGVRGNSSASSVKYAVEPSEEEREDAGEGERDSSNTKAASCSSRLEDIVTCLEWGRKREGFESLKAWSEVRWRKKSRVRDDPRTGRKQTETCPGLAERISS
jgi:hypothetical protein